MTSATFRPELRPEVECIQGPEGLSGLRQPGSGHFVKVGAVTRALAPLIDGTRTVDAILAKVPHVTRADAEESLRALLLLGFLRGAGDANLARLLTLERERPPVIFREGSRFTCQGSGQCCRIYALGPLDEDDVERLAALDLARAFPDLGPGPHVRRDESGTIYLERRDERCVYLLPDARCGIHAAFGAEAKPKLCRLYPWAAQLTVGGLRIVDQSECSTFASSVRQGEPLAGAQLDRVLALVPSSLEMHHPLVVLGPGVPCDYGWVVALEEALVRLVASSDDVGEALRRAGLQGRAFVEALARCPLEPGEPDRTVAAVLAHGPTGELPVGALPEVARALLAAIEGRSEPVIPRARAMLESLDAAGPAAGEPGLVREVLRASLANGIFSGKLLCEGRLRAGFLRLALVPLLTLAGARLLARERGLERGGERELSQAHQAASVALRMPTLGKQLARLEDHAWGILEVAARAVSAATAG